MNSFERFCFNLLGKRMKAKREDYAALRNDLISARFRTPFEVYLSTAYVSGEPDARGVKASPGSA